MPDHQVNAISAQELVGKIKKMASASVKKQMREKFGIHTDFALGTTVTNLRLLAKTLQKPDQKLAEALWATQIHEARILASIVADPQQMTLAKLDQWAEGLNSWDICDLCTLNLFVKTKNPFKLAQRWIKQEAEFTRRAGFAIIATLSIPRAATQDAELIKLLPVLKNYSIDPRPMVFKAVNWALRNIGKKNQRLTPKALACAEEILDLFPQNKTACWVAKNALYELKSPKVKEMLTRRK